jgi:hypothetical protein
MTELSGKAPIERVELPTSIPIGLALTDKTRTKRSKLESLSRREWKELTGSWSN